MKLSLVALALVTSAFSAAQAAPIGTQSHIDAVVVYPEGADVTRLIEAKLPAQDSSLLLSDLPATVDPQSLRVEGSADTTIEVLSVDSKLVTEAIDTLNAARQKITEQIEGLNDERATLAQGISDQEAQRNLLLSLASHPAEVKGDNAKPLDAVGIDALVNTVATRLADSSKVLQQSKIRQRAIDKEVAALQAKLTEQAPEARAHLQVTLHVHAEKETLGKLRLTYRVPEAGWHAFYDAKLSLPKAGQDAKLELIRQADVEQHTTENWQDVKLTLSTAAPSGEAAAPALDESEVSVYRQLAEAMPASPQLADGKMKAAKALDKVDAANAMTDGEADAPAVNKEAEVQVSGFTAQYTIVGRSEIDNSGTAKNVRIGSDQVAARLSVEAVPRLDTTAYLTATFTVKADEPLLAGPVHLFRDAAYVGQVELRELAGSEDAKLGFGVDDLVKVKRQEVKRLAAQEGFISSSNTQDTAWIIAVSNLHDIKMPIRILDRKPFSTDAQITVTDRSDNTPASVIDVDHKRGVLAWDLDLAPKTKAEIKTGYKISAPKDVKLSLNE